jgi:flagellar hook assembly protein FlgD
LTFYLTDNLFKTYSKSYYLKVKEKERIKDFLFFKINENLYGFAFKSDEVLSVKIKIYTLSGRLIKELKTLAKIGDNLIYWDRKDSFSKEIAKGIYLIKVSYSFLEGKEESFIKKIIVD